MKLKVKSPKSSLDSMMDGFIRRIVNDVGYVEITVSNNLHEKHPFNPYSESTKEERRHRQVA